MVEAAQLFQDQEKEDGVNWKRVAAYLNNEKSSKEYRTLWKNIVLPKLEEPMKVCFISFSISFVLIVNSANKCAAAHSARRDCCCRSATI